MASEYIYKSRDGINHRIPNDNVMQYVMKDYEKHGNRVAIVDGVTGRSYTYTQLKRLYTKFGSALTRKGFRQGDVLCIFSPNLPEYEIVVGAVLMIGGTVTTANPLYTADELKKQLLNADASFIVTIPEFADKVKQVKWANQNIKEIIVFGESAGCTPYADLANDTGGAFPSNVRICLDDVAFLLYSSGTTGLPKGVMLTHRNVVSNLFQMICTSGVMPYTPYVDCSLVVLPLYHAYGCIPVALGSLKMGIKFVTLPRFEPEVFLKSLQDYKITIAFLVPPLVLFLTKHPLVDNYKIVLKDVICGAAPLGGDLASDFKKRLNIPYVRQGYGLTEVVASLAVCKRDTPSVAAAGVLLVNTEAKIIDTDSGRSLSPGERGELWVRGPQVMKGYFKNPAATAGCIDAGGWFHTGDIGYFSEDGHLFIVDRLKELIKYKGLQVAPAELEGLLLTNPAIADAAVLGVPDERAGELPKAFVVLKANENLTEDNIAQFVADRVSPHKKLRGGVEIVEMIPKSASGKILRRQLRDLERERRAKEKKLSAKL